MARKTTQTQTTEKTADMLKAEIEQLKAQLKQAKEAEKTVEFVCSTYKEHTVIYRKNGNYYEKICSVKKLAEFLEYLDKHNGVLKLGELNFSNKEEPFTETGNTKIDL